MKKKNFFFETSTRNIIYSSLAFFVFFILVLAMARYVAGSEEKSANGEFTSACKDIQTKIVDRLNAQAQLLRCGAGLFTASDSVTRHDWNAFYLSSNIDHNLPGISGLGYTVIISPGELQQHIKRVRKDGIPDYTVYPFYKRDRYTSIVFLEPAEGRNRRAFGYDMYSDPVRREAMDIACDSNQASLSGRVILVQETGVDLQAGVLMFVPVYRKNLPVETVAQRRAAITGWVYSPYRMNELMKGILGNLEHIKMKGISIKIYDSSTQSEENLLFSSSDTSFSNENTRFYDLPVNYHGQLWILHLTERKQNIFLLANPVFIVTMVGILLCLLIFMVTFSILNSRLRARVIAEHLTEELRTAKLEAEYANNAKSEFLLNISHEFRTPLNSVIGYAGLLETAEGIKRKEYADLIESGGRKLLTMVNDILDFIRSEKSVIELENDYIETRVLLLDLEKKYRAQIEEKGLSFRLDLSDDLPFSFYTDGKKLKQVISNLITNSIRYTEKGAITLRAYINNSFSGNHKFTSLVIEVEDTGKGISEEFRKELFEPFAQGNRKTVMNGIGMGLPLTQRLLKSMNGRISVMSQPGQGSVFTVTMSDISTRSSSEATGSVLRPEAPAAVLKRINRRGIVNPEKLISELEGPFFTTCRTFETRQPITEVKNFGQEIKKLGQRHQCSLISEYGQSLSDAADAFDIEAMLRLIKSYQDNIESLRK